MDPIVGPWHAYQETVECPLALHVVVSVKQLPLSMISWEGKIVDMRDENLR